MISEKPCRFCGASGPHKVEVQLTGQHLGGGVRCIQCNRHLGWNPKAQDDPTKYKRPSEHRDLVAKYSKGFCELCFIKQENLPKGESLEAQHVVEYQDGGTNERDNIWILCTACHRLVHWQRTYKGHLLQMIAEATKRWQGSPESQQTKFPTN